MANTNMNDVIDDGLDAGDDTSETSSALSESTLSQAIEGELIRAVDKTQVKPYSAVEDTFRALAVMAEAKKSLDLSTKDGMRETREFIRDLSRLRKNLKVANKAAKDFFMGYVELVNKNAENIRERIVEIEDSMRKRIEDYKNEQERIRAEEELRRKQREEAIRRVMDPIQRAVISVAGKPSAVVKAKMDELNAMTAPDLDDKNVVQSWLAARNSALAQLAMQLQAAEDQERAHLEARRREERAERLSKSLANISGFLITAAMHSGDQAILERKQTEMSNWLDELAAGDEDPAFMAEVQRAAREARSKIGEMIAAAHQAAEDAAQRAAALKVAEEAAAREHAEKDRLMAVQAEALRAAEEAAARERAESERLRAELEENRKAMEAREMATAAAATAAANAAVQAAVVPAVEPVAVAEPAAKPVAAAELQAVSAEPLTTAEPAGVTGLTTAEKPAGKEGAAPGPVSVEALTRLDQKAFFDVMCLAMSEMRAAHANHLPGIPESDAMHKLATRFIEACWFQDQKGMGVAMIMAARIVHGAKA